MKELALKYGCNPNQKPSRIYMEEGELPASLLKIVEEDVNSNNFILIKHMEVFVQI